jgi:stress response protein YsnF
MATSVISMFDDNAMARKAMGALIKAGFEDQSLEILQGEADELASEIEERGFGKEEARSFAEAAGRGKTLLVAQTDAENAPKASAIMERFESSEGDDEDDDNEGDDDEGEEAVQGIEEELSVGKRKVVNGGVRVTTKVTETPVEETVTLRDETVEASRKPVSRKASADELDGAFKKKTVEMLGTSEEVEVAKEARVVEEVTLGKKAKAHQQTVQDNVRRSKVEVEKIEPKSRKSR